ncbi:MAG: S8 family serine peptidase [Acidobacteriota bacterium]
MPRKQSSLLGSDLRKVQPKLRMIANGSLEVNEVRADFSSSIRVRRETRLAPASPVQNLEQCLTREAPKTKQRLRAITGGIEANVFIERVGGHDQSRDRASARMVKGASQRLTAGNPSRDLLSTATIRLTDLARLASDDSVAFIELGEPLTAPTPEVSSNRVAAPSASLRRFEPGGGAGALIGIIDVQGFDFAHKDFLDATGNGTRFERIWDQGGSGRPAPPKFGYGSEIRKQHMNQAIRSAAAGAGLPAQLLEPQSQQDAGSHGTHVTSIAAGNRGICRKAFLAGVLISLPAEDLDRRRSFYDSTRLAHAVDYLFDLAEELRIEHQLEQVPVSINVSLGTNGHAHDGSSAVSRWIDSALAIPGRSVCVAAGNAGQEAPESEDDLGFVMGRIHTSGRIAARGLDDDIEWVVVGNSVEDVSENEFEIWYSPADRISVSLKPPGMDWTEPVEPGQFIENRQLGDRSFISIYNELYHPANGANYIAIYLSPFLSSQAIKGATAGVWHVRLHGIEVRDGRYHGWIERDDPRRLGRVGMRDVWRFPSFFSEQSNVDNSSVSSLACGHRIVSVANLDEARERINISSSQGPTRDGRFKPDVAAAGTNIVAARGFDYDNDQDWISMTGTSMASPFVTGVVGLMLAKNPKLTAAQIGGIIQRTARPLPGADFDWRDDAGYGVIDSAGCLREVELIHRREDLT